MAGTDHFCTDTGSGEVLCYFRATFLPLAKDGKIELSAKVPPLLTFSAALLAAALNFCECFGKKIWNLIPIHKRHHRVWYARSTLETLPEPQGAVAIQFIWRCPKLCCT